MELAYKSQIGFLFVFGIIVYAGYNEADDSVVNYKRGLQAAAFVLVCQGMLSQYKGPFTKGFEPFWRGVARYTMIYLVALIFILFQTASDARGLMRHLYPELGKPVVRGMHTYDDNCEIELENVLDNFDHYYVMHWVGWFVATLMIRDPFILHFWSILDEILELSWQHILPHFRECWWDHVFVDVLWSNTPAIIIGMFLIRKTGLREFDWLGRKGAKSVKDWDLFKNHRRFGGVCVLIIVIMANFLTGFFLINSLWIPPKNYLNVYRLSIWFLLGAITIGELHDDIETWGTPERKNNPISNEYRWITCGVVILEAVISYKFRHGTGNIMDNPTPLYISIPWALTFISCLSFYLYLRLKGDRTTKYGDSQWEIEARKKTTSEPEKKEKKQKVNKVEAKVEAKVEQPKVEQPKVEQPKVQEQLVQAKEEAPVKNNTNNKAQKNQNQNEAKSQKNQNQNEVKDQKKQQKVQKEEEPVVKAPAPETGKKKNKKGEAEPEVQPKPVETKPVEEEWTTVRSERSVRKANKKRD